MQLEKSESEVQEQENVQKFLLGTCECHLGVGNKPCSLSISPDAIRKSQNSYSELFHNELDLVVISQVHYSRTNKDDRESKVHHHVHCQHTTFMGSGYAKLHFFFFTASGATVTYA